MNRRSFLTGGLAAAAVLQAGSPAPAPAPLSSTSPRWSGRESRQQEQALCHHPARARRGTQARCEWPQDQRHGLDSRRHIHAAETLVFGLEDSGTDQYSITYQAVPGEGPIISSGVKIEGWKELDTMVNDLPVPAGARCGWRTFPNRWAVSTLCTTDRDTCPGRKGTALSRMTLPRVSTARSSRPVRNLYYPAGVIRNWSNLDDVEIVIRSLPSRSTMNILALESVDERARLARTSLPATYPLGKTTKTSPYDDAVGLGGKCSGGSGPPRRVGAQHSHPQALPVAAGG